MKKQTGTMSKVRWITLAVAAVVLVSLPFWGGDYIVNIFTLILMYMAIGEMWNLLAGICRPGFPWRAGVHWSWRILAGNGITGVEAAVLPWIHPCCSHQCCLCTDHLCSDLRHERCLLHDWYLACGRSALRLLPDLVLRKLQCRLQHHSCKKNQRNGYVLHCIRRRPDRVGCCRIILRSKFGLGLMAMRDNEAASEIRGVKLYKSKLICFLISSAITGVAGSALYLNLSYIKPTVGFGIDWTVSMVFIAVIGGMGTIEGPIIGAIIFVILRQLLYNFSGFSMLILGIIAVVMILVAPKGIMGLINKKADFDLFGVKRKVDISAFKDIDAGAVAAE